MAWKRDGDGIPNYRRWTYSSAYCYKRGCRCEAFSSYEECDNYKYCQLGHINFKIKKVILKMVRTIGIDRIESDLQRALNEEEENEYENSCSMPKLQRY